MYFDSHCHLDPDVYGGDAGVDAVVERAMSAGVQFMTTIGAGYGAKTAERAIQVAERHDNVFCTVGLHPHDAKEWNDVVSKHLSSFLKHPKCVAMGEMGLDFYYDNSPRDVQRQVLREQARMALEYNQPIVIHDRDADDEVLEILTEEEAFSGAGVLWHCFSGDVLRMEKIVDAGGYISIPGIITFSKPGDLPEIAREVPLHRLLIETDSPFLTPKPHRGTKNEPAYVVHVSKRIAEIRQMETEEIAAITTQNALEFYSIS